MERKKRSLTEHFPAPPFSHLPHGLSPSQKQNKTPQMFMFMQCSEDVKYYMLFWGITSQKTNKQTKPNQLFCKHSNSEARLQ